MQAAHVLHQGVAVLYAGAYVQPWATATWRTHLRHLVEPLRAMVFVYLTPDNVRLLSDRQHPTHNWTCCSAVKNTDRGGTLAKRGAICADVRAMMGPWLTDCATGANPRLASAQYIKVRALLNMYLQYEQDHPRARRAAFLLRCRLDMPLLSPLLPLQHSSLATMIGPRSPWVTQSRASRACHGGACLAAQTPTCWVLATAVGVNWRCPRCSQLAAPARPALYMADQFLLCSRAAVPALRSFAERFEALAPRPDQFVVTPAGTVAQYSGPETRLLLHLRRSSVRLRLLPLRNATFLAFDTWRYPGTLSLLNAALSTSVCLHTEKQRTERCRQASGDPFAGLNESHLIEKQGILWLQAEAPPRRRRESGSLNRSF